MRLRRTTTLLLSLSLTALVLAGCGGSSGSGGGGSNSNNAVGPAAKIVLSPATMSLLIGNTNNFSAVVTDANGNTISGATLTWASSATSVATVDATGKVTAVAAGTANITAATGGVTSAPGVVTVTAPPVASVTVAPSSETINVGVTAQFTAAAKDANGATVQGATFTWASSNAAVATVNSSGLVTGTGAGTANITATSQGVTSAPAVVTVQQPSSVGGTAATGAPLAGLTVTLKDATGASATATTAADGTFSVNSTGLKPPFLLSVTPNSGTPLYSFSADANTTTTINVDPLTDLAVRAWYGSQGQTADAGFASPTSAPAPSPVQLQPLLGFVQNQVQLWLNNNGVTAANFNLISTSFAANGSGEDKVLDDTTVTNTQTGSTVAITDGTTTQSTALTYSTSTNSVTATTTTTSGSSSSTNTSTTVVPVTNSQTGALAAINAQCAALTAVFANKGANLADTDIEPFMTSTLEFEGLTQEQFAAELATFARGVTASMTATQLNSLDTTHGTANVHVLFQLGQSQLSADINFTSASGAWLMSGDGRVAAVDVSAEFDTNQTGTQTTTQSSLNADVKAAPGLVTAATVGGSAFGASTAIPAISQQQQTFAPTSSTSETVTLDHFNLGETLTALVAANTPITFNLTTTNGAVSYTLYTNAATTEGIQFTNISSSALTALTLGGNNSFTWTLPKTFPIASIQLKADAYNGDPNNPATADCRVQQNITSITATSGSVSVPATCSGTIVAVQIALAVDGLNGEDTEVFAQFGQNFNSGEQAPAVAVTAPAATNPHRKIHP